VGDAEGAGITGTLRSESAWVTVTDDQGVFGDIPIDAQGENDTDRFALQIASDCYPGHVAAMELCLEFSGGARDTVVWAMTVGAASTDDPTGPDGYGYYAFDNSDVEYEYAPTYDWIEIDPVWGGEGTSVGLDDFGEDEDDSRTVALPFPITYYGQTFTEATICSNGWIAMGSTYLTNYRNWIIPGAGAPPNMIAPMWDNLRQSGNDQVYHWFDEANHRYIVEWSRLRNMEGGDTETFQAIFLDTAHHPSPTGDGRIIFQYHTFSNSDDLQHYSTMGIQNADGSDGLLYGYYNYHNTAAAPVAAGRAVQFVAFDEVPRGLLSGSVTNATGGGTPVPQAHVQVVELGSVLTSSGDGVYGGSVPVGTYTLIATHPSFTPDTLADVPIVEGETTVRDFALHDVGGPRFEGTTDYAGTDDTVGPYEIETTVVEYSGCEDLMLYYSLNAGDWVGVTLEEVRAGQYAAEIPGQPAGTVIRYYLYGRDVADNIGTDPENAPVGTYLFCILDEVFSDDMEDGTGTWTHEVVTGGYVDQWHRSSQRSYSGDWSWKFGDTGSDAYATHGDGALVSEPFDLPGDGLLTFWHWIEAAWWYQGDVALDGGIVEMSVDGAAWEQIHPSGGYPWELTQNQDWGTPFDPGIPLYSGEQDWEQAEFELSDIAGTARIRFRFGSDQMAWPYYQGWFIDDVRLVGGGPDLSAARELELMPSSIALHANRPNPCRRGTDIGFDLPQAAPVRLQILDVGGRVMRTLLDARLPGGHHACSWDGLTSNGDVAGSGFYFYRLEVGDQRRARRLLLVR